jgi:hypothetical protein
MLATFADYLAAMAKTLFGPHGHELRKIFAGGAALGGISALLTLIVTFVKSLFKRTQITISHRNEDGTITVTKIDNPIGPIENELKSLASETHTHLSRSRDLDHGRAEQ